MKKNRKIRILDLWLEIRTRHWTTLVTVGLRQDVDGRRSQTVVDACDDSKDVQRRRIRLNVRQRSKHINAASTLRANAA